MTVSASRTVTRTGVLASVAASSLFGVIFLLPPHLRPLRPEQILGWRILAMIGFLAAHFAFAGRWPQVVDLVRLLRARPVLIAVVIADALLLGLQLWLFGWAPQTGHGLDLSLGYLMLPLVMVVLGVAVYREKLSGLRVAAVVAATVGVVAAVVFAGGLQWPTLLVAFAFPPYFMLRRAFAVDTPAAQLLELIAMVPFAVFTLIATPSVATVAQQPSLIAGLLLLGLLSAAGFALYLAASSSLPLAVFGILSYVEPVLLVLVSLTLLGETWHTDQAITYGPICAGLALLAADSLAHRAQVTSSKDQPTMPAPSPHR